MTKQNRQNSDSSEEKISLIDQDEIQPKSKKPVFKDVEDVISIGALMRPSFVQAVSRLSSEQAQELYQTLCEIEKTISDSSCRLVDRFQKMDRLFLDTFHFAPAWRFIAGKVRDVWSEAQEPSVKELSVVSLLIGMLLEEAKSKMQGYSKNSENSKTRHSA